MNTSSDKLTEVAPKQTAAKVRTTAPSESTSTSSASTEPPCGPEGADMDPIDQELLAQRRLSWTRNMTLACKRMQAILTQYLGRLRNTMI